MTQNPHSAETHEVVNQPGIPAGYNAYSDARALHQLVHAFGGGWGEGRLIRYGQHVGHELLDAGTSANIHPPELQTHDLVGRRINQVDYHPGYHQLMASAIEAEQIALPWSGAETGAQVVRAALVYLHTQADPGSQCPLTMSYAAVPVLRQQPEIARDWLPKLLKPAYDERNVAPVHKPGVTLGMAMTEKQGGSDLRANTTHAEPLGGAGPGQAYAITGHKWFCSAPMSDAFLMLAKSEGGLSCFLMPRWRSDETLNAMHLQRLKQKVGNCANATAEVEYRGAEAWMIGEEGRGIATLMDMVMLTRTDCVVSSAAMMGQATRLALHYARGRDVFGSALLSQPLMRNLLADLALEAEAALVLGLRLAQALDHDTEEQRSVMRIGTAVGKYWVCRQAIAHTAEAMEAVGGIGYCDPHPLARLYREAPVNSIWEGAGNIQCLDVARAAQTEPARLEAFIQELELSRGMDTGYDNALNQLLKSLQTDLIQPQYLRRVVESMALVWQAGLLMRFSEPAVADAFIRSRLAGQRSRAFGTLHGEANLDMLIERASPNDTD